MLFLLACSTELKDDTGSPDTGSSDSGDAPCEWLPAGDRLVLADACVDGLCGGSPYPDAVSILGEPDTCAADAGVAACTWGDVTVTFNDCDLDGAPDEKNVCDLYEQTFQVAGAWDGASAEGLGLGVRGSCWQETLGPMDGSGWTFGENPWVHVGVVPYEGPVTTIVLSWSFEE